MSTIECIGVKLEILFVEKVKYAKKGGEPLS